jgi:hypothetical protein
VARQINQIRYLEIKVVLRLELPRPHQERVSLERLPLPRGALALVVLAQTPTQAPLVTMQMPVARSLTTSQARLAAQQVIPSAALEGLVPQRIQAHSVLGPVLLFKVGPYRRPMGQQISSTRCRLKRMLAPTPI